MAIAIRSMTFNSKCRLKTSLYKTRNLLKLNCIYRLELAKFIYQLNHQTDSQSRYDCVLQLSDVHSRDEEAVNF